MEHHPSGARSRRAHHGRVESRPRRFPARTLVALLVAGAAALPGLVAPERADADPTLEPPGTGTVPVTSSAGRLGAATINGSGFDRTTNVPDNAYVGTVRGAGPFDAADPAQSSAPLRAGTAQPMLDAGVAAGDYWTYIARGLPAANPADAGVISPQDTNALGYKPNNPGNVPISTPFLLGTLRHNNFQVHSANHWLHSSIDVAIGGIEDSFPFDQEETEDDTDTTAALSDEGAYMLASRANGPSSCPAHAPYAALNRDAGPGVWYCYRHVGKRRGNRDIYTNNLAAYPDAAGTPDQSPNSEDVLTISRTTSTKTVMIDGIPYRLVIAGFTPSADGDCPATPPEGVTPVSTFTSKENKTSYGCLYASFSQERYIRIAKTVTAESEAIGGTIPSFNFTTLGIGDFVSPTGEPLATDQNASGFVDWSSFSDTPLTPTGYGKDGTVTSGYQAFIPGYSQFVIAETGPRIPGRRPLRFGEPGYFGPWKISDDPNSGRWELTDISCVNGVGEAVNVTRDPVTGGIDFSDVPPAKTAAAVPITCNFTIQQQAPKLRINKAVESVEGASGDTITVTYRVTATNDGTIAGTTGRLVDTPAFAPGLTLRSAAIATSLEGLGAARAQNAAASYILTQGTTVEPGEGATWYVRMTVARNKAAAGYSESLLECAPSNGRLAPGHGLYNSVAGPYDHDGAANNEDCAPARPRPIRIEKAGTQPMGTANEDGTYPLGGAAFAIYDNEALAGTPLSTSDGDSQFVTAPLEPSRSYWLVETRAPAGHALLPRPVPFHITVGADASSSTEITTDFGADDGFSSVRVIPAAAGTGDAALPAIRVVDTQVGTLPNSGSLGIYPHLGAGATLIILSGGSAWARRRDA
ncbi:prealbumin-like fold domain-containing protein [uncultured Actinomyces sp.]|uniref:prealbumin-like fold domain-containing protein n=1 Tax=uncultured Actinomyces sp. TaxID=249061 RepID=UPI0025EEF877|nr:prealbumin-like fold domain-containing protein [uncultured Actinomyces sp.]